MRSVLLVAMPNSVHVARICKSISRAGWNVYLFPCHDATPHRDLADLVLFDPTGSMRGSVPDSVDIRAVFPWSGLAAHGSVRAAALAAVVARLRPDIIHAQELQHAGYLVVGARLLMPRFPPIITTIWGSDLSIRWRLPEERRRILEVFRCTDLLTAECERDIRTARAMGYSGETAQPMAVAGGLDPALLEALRAPGPASRRRTIAVKGYQGWAGRSQVALRALERCGSSLAGYRIAVYLAHPDTAILAERLGTTLGLEVEIISGGAGEIPHEDILAMHGRSRISIGLSFADGISTSFLEAIAMGSFPIQSGTACVDEWITDGQTGFIVPSDDPVAAAAALKTAIEDDALVDRAAALNQEVVRRRLDGKYLQTQLMALYDRVADHEIARSDHRAGRGGLGTWRRGPG